MPVNEALVNGPVFGNMYVKIICGLGFAFLMGSIPFRAVVGWLFDTPGVRDKDRVNLSIVDAFGRVIEASVPFFDALKGWVPTAIVFHGGGEHMGVAAAFCAVLGDCYSPWRKWRGGKGVATYAGALFALSWQAGTIFTALWMTGAFSSGYTTIGSLLACAVSFLPLWYFVGAPSAMFGVEMACIIATRHRPNIRNLLAGTEPSLRLESPESAPAASRQAVPALSAKGS
jgi:glycerol-3-phosphate acyltransferase PlsY